jgi:hypothetical protein
MVVGKLKKELVDKKFEEMFEINTHLNRRLNELELHKKKLIELV